MEEYDLNTLQGLIDKANSVMAKTLTTKDRKKMKDSAFCGPNKSFPVPDCKHVAVAKAYLGKSKFSKSAKEKIAACINKKAKKLGCDVSKKAKAGENDTLKFIELSYEQKQLYTSEVFASTKALVEKSCKNPGMELDFVNIDTLDEA